MANGRFALRFLSRDVFVRSLSYYLHSNADVFQLHAWVAS